LAAACHLDAILDAGRLDPAVDRDFRVFYAQDPAVRTQLLVDA